jgi:hypothetical protein
MSFIITSMHPLHTILLKMDHGKVIHLLLYILFYFHLFVCLFLFQ